MSISDIITFIEDNIENQETYNVELEGALDSFRIQTIHGSKGLEYPIVFIVNCNLQSFPSTMSNTDSLTFNEIVGLRSRRIYSAEHEFLFDNWKSDLVNIGLFSDMDEERRLLYVAITRAMYDVYFTASRPSEFFNSLGDESIQIEEEVELEPIEAAKIKSSSDLEIKTQVESKNQVLSVHDLMTFKEGQQGRGKEFGTILHKLAFRYIKKLSIEDLAEDLNRTLTAARAQLISIEKQLKKPTILPGPTGESNVLYLENRGNIICFADKDVSFHFWTLSVVTALATGNTVISVVSDLFYDEAIAFRDKFLATGADKNIFQVAKLGHLSAMLMHPALAGVVVDSLCDRKHYISEKLAEREGAILPVITSEYFDNLIQRLLTEKTISIDTTASGGNTSLMTLVEDE